MFCMAGEAIKLHLIFSFPWQSPGKKAPVVREVNHKTEAAFVQTNPEDFISHLVH